MSHRGARLSCVLLTIVLAASIDAQHHTDKELGFKANRVYQLEGVDNVNLFNGNVVVTVPLGLRYEVSPWLSYQFLLSYNSKVWELRDEDGAIGGETGRYPRAHPHRRSNAGLGWRLSFGRLIDPDDPTNDPWRERVWIYESADGAEHVFETPGSTARTKDGSNLRMVIAGDIRKIEHPDGTVHSFHYHGTRRRWLLHDITDRYGNRVDVDYVWSCGDPAAFECANVLQWIIRDSRARTHRVYFQSSTMTSSIQRGQVVERIELQSVGGATAMYQLVYFDPPLQVEYGCGHTRMNANSQPPFVLDDPTVVLPLLKEVRPPSIEGPPWAFTYYLTGQSPEATCEQGALNTLALPTGGTIEYKYGVYFLPDGDCTDGWARGTPGVRERKVGSETATYQQTLGPSIVRSLTSEELKFCGVENPLSPAFRWSKTSVKNVVGHRTDHYFSAFQSFFPDTSLFQAKTAEYGLPFTRSRGEPEISAQTDGRFLSREVYECDAAGQNCKLSRQDNVRYAYDAEIGPPAWNARVESESAAYFDVSGGPATGQRVHSAESEYSEFDFYGHHRLVLTRDFDGTTRQSRTDWNSNRTSGADTDPAVPWLTNSFTYQWVEENGRASKRLFSFDGTTGSLKSVRSLKAVGSSGASLLPGPGDTMVASCYDGEGNLASERYFGGDGRTVPSGDPCLQTRGAGEYRLNYNLEHGLGTPGPLTRRTIEYDGGGFFVSDVLLDPSTGLTTESRDSANRAVRYEYDLVGRLSRVKPDAAAWTVYSYEPASAATFAAVQVAQYPNGMQSGQELSKSRYEYDRFGRLQKEITYLPGGGTATRQTLRNSLGWITAVSELETVPTFFTRFSTFDPFGRARSVVAADGATTTLAFVGSRAVTETKSVMLDLAGSRALTPVATLSEYDRYGRLRKVTEGAGALGASYLYDESDRLRKVELRDRMGNTQTREFDYDGRGFLTWESHGELGAASNGQATGKILYEEFDARGHSGKRTYPSVPLPDMSAGVARYVTYDLRYTYDAAERLTAVWSRDPNKYCVLCPSPVDSAAALGQSNSAFRLLKQYLYGTSGADKGKLVNAVRFNYNPGMVPYSVTDIFSYGGNGLVQTKKTEIRRDGSLVRTHQQSYLYNDLTDVSWLGYPTCVGAAGCGQSTLPSISNSYSAGRLSGVGGFAGISYHPNGFPSSISHEGGVTDSQTIRNGMARPDTISFTGARTCDPPVITQQPGTLLVPANTPTTLRVSATGSGTLTYYWYKGAVGDRSYDPVKSGPENFLNIAGLQQTTLYWVRVVNTCGVTSTSGHLAADDASASDITTTAAVWSEQARVRIGTFSASPSPIQVCDGTGLGVTTLTWNFPETASVGIRVGSPSGTLFASSGASGSSTTGKWVSNSTVFYAQDASKPLVSENTLATLSVPVQCSQPYAASFVAQTVPASMTAGQTYSVSITLKNNGTNAWTAADSYKLGSQNPADNTRWSLSRVALPAGVTVAQGGQHTFTFSVTAPSTAGTHNFQWQMVREFVTWFGDMTPNIAVTVTSPNAATFVSQSVPAQMAPGQATSVSVTMRNTGTNTWSSANGYKLGSQNPVDNTTWGLNRVSIPAGVTVAPNAQYTFTFVATAPAAAGTYAFQWRMLKDAAGWFGNASTSVSVLVCAAPAISVQPSSRTINSGQSTTLSVTASGTGLTYQWYTGASGGGTAISGATAATLSVSPAATTSYWVKVTGTCGTVNSATATVTISCTPVITSHPQSQAVPYGNATTLSVSATGSGLAYQWYKGTSGVTTQPVGTNASTYRTPSITAAANYWVRVSNTCGAVNSNTASLSVCTQAYFWLYPQSQTISAGQTVTMTVGTGGTNVTLEWYDDTQTLVSTASTYTTPPLYSTRSYSVTARNQCSVAYGSWFTITVQ